MKERKKLSNFALIFILSFSLFLVILLIVCYLISILIITVVNVDKDLMVEMSVSENGWCRVQKDRLKIVFKKRKLLLNNIKISRTKIHKALKNITKSTQYAYEVPKESLNALEKSCDEAQTIEIELSSCVDLIYPGTKWCGAGNNSSILIKNV